ncbi:class II glutamine amidotransferase [Candidatus Bipolaricaulota bacterium]
MTACWEDKGIQSIGGNRVFLLHARRASRGAVNQDNVHPFQAAVGDARWSYCHNGTVKQTLEIPTSLRKQNSTDSETMFHLLLPYVEHGRVLEGLRAIYSEIQDYSSLNSFLLGPEALWAVCLHTKTPEYFTLHLAMTGHGPVISSEALEELGTQQTALSSGQVVRIDRVTGDIEELLL